MTDAVELARARLSGRGPALGSRLSDIEFHILAQAVIDMQERLVEKDCLIQDDRREILAQRAQTTALRTALGETLGALQWCSGAPDFNVGGHAAKGWVKVARPAIEQAEVALSATKEGE